MRPPAPHFGIDGSCDRPGYSAEEATPNGASLHARMNEPDLRITELLGAADAATSEELLPLVYEELRNLARARFAHERAGQTLQPTALVHEAFMRLGCPTDHSWEGRRHYFAAAAEAMRRILIDQARRKASHKHGGGHHILDVDDHEPEIEAPDDDLIDLDDALCELEAIDPRAREIVNLRYFVGLTTEETASALGVSVSTVEREWRFLRTFIEKALMGDGAKE